MRVFDALKTRDPAAVGYILAWKVVGVLPMPIVRWIFETAGARVARSLRVTKYLRRNLARVLGKPAPDALVEQSMRSYARYWAEAFRLPVLSRGDLGASLDSAVDGREHLDNSLAKGKGVVLTLPHCGNWDMAGVWLVHHAGSFTTVAERLRPEVLFDAFVEFREGLGFRVIPHVGGDPAFPRLKQVLEAGGIVCLLGERDLKGSGVPVSFFGEATSFPAGPAQLALSTGAALHTVDAHFTDSGWGFSISEPLEVDTLEATVQRIANNFERSISAHPQDWHMLQPVWLTDRQSAQ